MRTNVGIVLVVQSWLAIACAGAAEPDVNGLIQALSSADPQARSAAADALISLGPAGKAASPALLQALEGADPVVRWHAARALGFVAPDPATAIPALARHITDPDATVRAQSLYALGLLGEAAKPVVPAIAERIADEDTQVRRAAIGALIRIRPGSAVTIPLLIKVLEHTDPSMVTQALQTLAEVGEPIVPAARETLKNERSRYWGCLLLADLGPKAKAAVPDLEMLIFDKQDEVRLQALIALGEIGPDGSAAVPSIIKGLEDKVLGVRYAAAFALGRIGAKDARPALTATMASGDPFLKMLCAWALARANPDDRELVGGAVALLVDALKSPESRIRSTAVRALFELKAPPEVVAPAMIELMKDADDQVKANVVQGLVAMGAPIAPRVANGLKYEPLRELALAVLSQMGPAAKETVPNLIEALKTDNPRFRSEVQFTLGAIGPDAIAAVPELIKGISDPVNEVKYSACYALGRIGPSAMDAVPSLSAAAKSDDEFLRLSSVLALVKIVPKDNPALILAVPVLIKGLEHEHELVRRESAEALGSLGPSALQAREPLKKLLTDADESVRNAAAEALKKIG